MRIMIFFLFIFMSNHLFAASDTQPSQNRQYLLIGLVIFVIIVLLIDILLRKKRPEDSEPYKALSFQNNELTQKMNQSQGKSEQLQNENHRLESQMESRSRQISELEKQLNSYQANETQDRKNTERKISELDNARIALAEERQRVLKDEQSAKEEEEENRNRIWALHEDKAKSLMHEICQKSKIGLSTFDNTNLPDGFDPKFKPDFMLNLLGLPITHK